MLRISVFVTAVLTCAPALAQNQAAGSDQLSQFLTRNAWCGFTYNQRSGTVAGQSGGKEYMVCN